MARSPPPAAINASMAALTTSTSTSSQSSDLPLRNYTSSPEPIAGPAAPGPPPAPDSLPAVPQSNSSLPPPPPETPSSVAAEYGDGVRDAVPSAAVITEGVIKAYSRSRSRSGTSNQGQGRVRDTARSSTPVRKMSPSEDRSRSLQRKEMSPEMQALNDKVQRFLNSMAPPNAGEEVMKENRSLHQRIAALQRTERDLLNDNQDLARRLSSTQKRHDARRQKWKEELLNREKLYEARIKDLETRLARQEEELVRVAIDRSQESAWSDSTISAWLATKAATWREWVDDFAHRDANRVQSGLHPLQLRELCDGVKHFVQLTDEEELPADLLTPATEGLRTAHILLHGMLANFIMSETLRSPFWVFDVICPSTLELESPIVPRLDSMSPVGFRMDLAMLSFSVAPPRDVRSPLPILVPNHRPAEPEDVRKLPRLLTSIPVTGLCSGPPTGLLDQNLPSRQTMERLYQAMLNVQGGNDNANPWRGSVMKAFCEAGMCADTDNVFLTENVRQLAEARLRFATRLKDSFLRGPARYLLRDQDATGIEKLERRLMQEIDAALRFSCQIWCRRDPPWVKGLRELGDTTFKVSRKDTELCLAQAPLSAQLAARATGAASAPAGHHEGRPIVMVVQPSFGVSANTGKRKPVQDNTKIWGRASVLVAAPRATTEPAAIQDADTVAASDPTSPDSVKALVGTPTFAAPPPVPPKDPRESTLVLLPRIAFGDTPRSLPRKSPSLTLPLIEAL